MTRRLPSRNILRLPTLPLHQSEHAASGRVSRPRVRLLRLQVAAALVLGMVWSLVPPGAGASTNTWTTLSAPMTTARDSLGAVSGPCKGNLSATCLYALGGYDAGSNALNSVEMYDPSSNAWTTLSSSLATPRFSMGAASGPCQGYTVAICLYAIGGMDANNNILSSVARFDPTTVSTVPIVQGWNLLDLPLMQSTPTTASSLVSYLDGASQLGAGSVRALATYASGRFSLYVSGYSSNLSLQSTQGIFLLSNKSGTWVPTGVSYPSGSR